MTQSSLKTWYVCWFESSMGYLDRDAQTHESTVEAATAEEAKAHFKEVIYCDPNGHRELTDEEQAHVMDCMRGEEAYASIERWDDPKYEPREL